MNVTCENCGEAIDASDFLFEATVTCPSCCHSFALPQQADEDRPAAEKGSEPASQTATEGTPPDSDPADFGLNVSAGDFDELLQAESHAPSINRPHRPDAGQARKKTDEKSESLLRAYGAGQENLQRRLSKDSIKKIDRGLRLHFIATISFTLFLFFSSLGVGAFLGSLSVGAYVQESVRMKENMKLSAEVRQGHAKKEVFFLAVAGILLVVSVVCFILGALPLGASIVIDFLSLLGCLSFPREKGARTLQIIAAVFRGIAAVAFIGGVSVGLLLGASVAASLCIGAGLTLLPLVVAWICFCTSLGQVGAYLKRDDVIGESRRLLVVGITTMIILTALPILSFTMIVSGNGFWLVGIVGSAVIVAFFLLRQDPVAYFVNFVLYLTSLKFSIEYANYLQSVREVVSRGHKPDDSPRFLKPV